MFLNNLVIAESFQDISLLDRRQIQSPLFFSNHLISRDMILIPPCSLFFSPQISPEMCVYLFLMLLLPYHTFQFGTFDTNMLEHFAAAPKLESQKANGRGKRRERERERHPVIFQLWMPVFWVSLCLIISYQSFNLGARSGRFKPWKQLALCSPTVRVSFAVDDGNIKPVSREWTSQSESLQLS